MSSSAEISRQAKYKTDFQAQDLAGIAIEVLRIWNKQGLSILHKSLFVEFPSDHNVYHAFVTKPKGYIVQKSYKAIFPFIKIKIPPGRYFPPISKYLM